MERREKKEEKKGTVYNTNTLTKLLTGNTVLSLCPISTINAVDLPKVNKQDK